MKRFKLQHQDTLTAYLGTSHRSGLSLCLFLRSGALQALELELAQPSHRARCSTRSCGRPSTSTSLRLGPQHAFSGVSTCCDQDAFGQTRAAPAWGRTETPSLRDGPEASEEEPKARQPLSGSMRRPACRRRSRHRSHLASC